MRETVFAVSLASALIAGGAQANTLENGVNRLGDGTVDAVIAPAEIVKGIGDDAEEYGPVAGVVIGTAKGTVKAAGKVAKGGAKLAVGAVEAGAGIAAASVSPITGE
ncbi:MAG: hypothetical protein ACU84Q_13270 [Gammaproteobacteria bacterium]